MGLGRPLGSPALRHDTATVAVDQDAADVAWCHEVERGEAMLGGRSELEDFALRVTSIYRREEGQWRIVLRHADPIVVPRPPDATLG